MCGLWGVVAKNRITKEQFDLFRELGVVSTLRGYDSSGVALASKTKKRGYFYNWYKGVEPACNLVWDEKIAEFFIKSHNPLVLMGHARAATVGSVTYENSHPFRTDKLLGMHNGTIHSLREKDRTDSEVLYERIDKDGLEKTLCDIKGQKAYALTWFDRTDGTFNVLRNHERPLYFSYSTDQRIMVYASDDAFLKLIDARYPGLKLTVPVLFEMDQHYCFKHGEIVPTKTRVRDYIPFVSNLLSLGGHFRKPPGDAEKRAMMEEMQKELELTATNTNTGLTPEDMKPGSTTTRESEILIPKELSIPSFLNLAERAKPPVLLPNTEGSDFMSIDKASVLFRNKVTMYPMKISVNKVIKFLVYRLFDGSYALPSVAAPLLATGCCYSGKEATITDNVVWISHDAYVAEEHFDIPLVTEALAVHGKIETQKGSAFYVSLPKMKQLRTQSSLTGMPF